MGRPRAREADKVVHSVARYIACLEPMWGSLHYFEYKLADAIARSERLQKELERLRCSTAVTHFGKRVYVCPFCGTKTATAGAMVTHIVKRHREDILEILEER